MKAPSPTSLVLKASKFDRGQINQALNTIIRPPESPFPLHLFQGYRTPWARRDGCTWNINGVK